MKNIFLRLYGALTAFLLTVLLTAVPVLADNPMTGDERGQMLGLVMILLAVSVVLIIVFAILGKKGKKK